MYTVILRNVKKSSIWANKHLFQLLKDIFWLKHMRIAYNKIYMKMHESLKLLEKARKAVNYGSTSTK